jgi:hypothetical protein
MSAFNSSFDEEQNFLLNWDHSKIESVFNDHEYLAAACNGQRLKLPSSPEQSEFRVYAFLIISLQGKLKLIEGSNAEQGYIGGNLF